MIRKDDKILVGLSGGKDSGLLLYALSRLRARSPVAFALRAVTVDPVAEGSELQELGDYAKMLDVPLDIIRYPIFDILASSAEQSHCSLCANLRRGILASHAAQSGCNVLALGHHKDDAVETVLLNLFYAGRFGCFQPHMRMSRSKIRVIRPLIYVPEREIEAECRKLTLPLVDFCCPYATTSHRVKIKSLLASLERESGDVSGSVIHALRRSTDGSAWGSRHLEDTQGEDDYDFD